MESVRTDRFWSCGLTPRDAAITKSQYYPGENNLGRMLESIRDALLSDSTSTSYDEHEPIQTTSTDGHKPSTSVVKSATLSLSDSSLREVAEADAGSHATSPSHPVVGADASVFALAPSFSAESLSHATTARDMSPREVSKSAGPSVLARHSPPTFTGATKLIASPTQKPKTQIKLREKGKDKPNATTKKINITTVENHPKHKISDSPLNQQNEKDEKNQFMLSWLKRKLSPEKEAETANTKKQLRSETMSP